METLKNLKENTVSGDFLLSMKEDDNNIFFSYKNGKDSFCLIYSKEKDICLMVKNDKPASVSQFNDQETMRYKEVLDIAICYHHDRDGELLH